MCVCVWMNSPMPINVPIRDTWSLPLICMYILSIEARMHVCMCVYTCVVQWPYMTAAVVKLTQNLHMPYYQDVSVAMLSGLLRLIVQIRWWYHTAVYICARGSTLCPCFSVAPFLDLCGVHCWPIWIGTGSKHTSLTERGPVWYALQMWKWVMK